MSLTSWAAWRASLRIARREALRHKGRSALVVAMMALPVLGMTAGDVLVRTQQLSPEERVSRAIGQADAVLVRMGDEPFQQTPDGLGWDSSNDDGSLFRSSIGPDAYGSGDVNVAPLLPEGAHVVLQREGTALISTRSGLLHSGIREFDAADPLARGLVRLRGGRTPRTPAEVALSAQLLRETGAHVGEALELKSDGENAMSGTFQIVGTVVDPRDTKGAFVLAMPGTVLDATSATRWLVSLPVGVPVSSVVPALNDNGTLVQPREYRLHPLPTPWTRAQQDNHYGTMVVGVGLALLQVILLAATAFAVGARRQGRDLALVAVAGGTRQQVRAVVLGSGAVLGLTGAAVGIAFGIPLAAAVEPIVLGRLSNSLPGPFDVRPLEVLVIAAVGLLTGLVAAALPARGASRQSVTAALAGRRGITRTRRSMTLVGLVMVVIGASAAAVAARSSSYNGILAGGVLTELGFVACSPAMVGAFGNLAGGCTLPVRLALRDASRNRTRSGPAVAAIMAALAGCIALSTVLVSTEARDRNQYHPRLQHGQVRLNLPAGDGTDGVPTEAQLSPVLAALPVRNVALFHSGTTQLQGLDGRRGFVAVGDSNVVRAVVGRDEAAASEALAEGKLVALAPNLITDGQANLATYLGAETGPRQTTVPAVEFAARAYLPYEVPAAVVSAQTAARLGITADTAVALIDTTRMPSSREEQKAQAALDGLGGGYLYVERGFHGRTAPELLALLAMSVVVTFGATAVATGLAAAEGRSDLHTLSAVGAGPQIGRGLAMAQAATIAWIGALLGVVAGLVPALAVLSARRGYPLVLPWTTIGVGVVAVPLLAAAFAGLIRRSRLPAARRTW